MISRTARAAMSMIALAGMAMFLFAACGSNGGNNFSASCPTGHLGGGQPVQIVFWHAMTAANRDTLERMVGEFNASQSDVQVQAVFQGTYTDNLTKYFTALKGGDLPDLVQVEDASTQRMIDSGSVARAQDCIDAEKYSLSDYVDRVVAYYSVNGALWPYPFNVSNPVLYYNKVAFQKAGLDPEKPPATLDEVRQYSEQIVRSGATRHGLALELSSWYFEQWLSKAGGVFADHDNGRSGRVTGVQFDSDIGRQLFRWMDSMVGDNLAVNIGRNPSGADALLAVGSGDAAMTIGSSAAMRSVYGVLESGQFPDVKVGVGRMPGLQAQDLGGMAVGGGSMFVVNRSSPAKQEAARVFARWLNDPDRQAEWHVGSGYVPMRKSATDLPAVRDLWTSLPQFRVAYDQLQTGETGIASAGTVLGDYASVREAIVKAMEEMLLQGKDPDAALGDAAKSANAAIADYNQRVR